MTSDPRSICTEFHMPRFDTCVYWHPSMQEDAKNHWLRRTLLAALGSRLSRQSSNWALRRHTLGDGAWAK